MREQCREDIRYWQTEALRPHSKFSVDFCVLRIKRFEAILARLEQQEPQPANRGELTALVKRLRALPDLTDAVDLLGEMFSTLAPTSTSVDVAALRALSRWEIWVSKTYRPEPDLNPNGDFVKWSDIEALLPK